MSVFDPPAPSTLIRKEDDFSNFKPYNTAASYVVLSPDPNPKFEGFIFGSVKLLTTVTVTPNEFNNIVLYAVAKFEKAVFCSEAVENLPERV